MSNTSAETTCFSSNWK